MFNPCAVLFSSFVENLILSQQRGERGGWWGREVRGRRRRGLIDRRVGVSNNLMRDFGFWLDFEFANLKAVFQV